MTGTMQGPAQKPKTPTTKLCSRCDAKMFQADRGYGSTAWACPTHGFDRMIRYVPKT